MHKLHGIFEVSLTFVIEKYLPVPTLSPPEQESGSKKEEAHATSYSTKCNCKLVAFSFHRRSAL